MDGSVADEVVIGVDITLVSSCSSQADFQIFVRFKKFFSSPCCQFQL